MRKNVFFFFKFKWHYSPSHWVKCLTLRILSYHPMSSQWEENEDEQEKKGKSLVACEDGARTGRAGTAFSWPGTGKRVSLCLCVHAHDMLHRHTTAWGVCVNLCAFVIRLRVRLLRQTTSEVPNPAPAVLPTYLPCGHVLFPPHYSTPDSAYHALWETFWILPPGAFD